MTSQKDYFIIQPAMFRLDGGAMYGIIPKPLWEKNSPPDELNRIDLALRLLLIKAGKRNVLIDTGIGDYHGDKFDQQFDVRSTKKPLEAALKQINLTPEDITDLIISHLHFDHIGGIVNHTTEGFEEALPKAKLHLHKKHWEYSQKPTQRDAGSFHTKVFTPVIEKASKEGRVHWLDGKEGEIIPELGLKFITSFGHTPWMIHPHDDKVIYMADLIPTAHHIHIPWVMGYDIAPGVTTEDKDRVLPFIEENNLKMVFEHDPEFWGASLTKDDRGRYTAFEKYHCNDELAYQV